MLFKRFGWFELHVFRVEHGWSYNWIIRLGGKIVFHVAMFKKE